MKIAIFSGEIPSTEFIERLILGVAKHHKVVLFGIKKKTKKYNLSNISQIVFYNSTFKNALVSLWRSAHLLVKYPRDFRKLFDETRQYKSHYDKWIWYTRLLPIVLNRPDIIHLQWTRDVEFYACLKLKFGIPIVVSFRGAHINYTPIFDKRAAAMYRKYFPDIDAFHAVSKAIVEEASKYGDIGARTQVIYSPIPDYFFKAFPKPSYKINGRLNLVSVGRLHWKKGYSYALESLSQLKSHNIKFKYHVIGINHPNEELIYLINQLDLSNEIKFIGDLSQKKLITFLQQQDILLLPSVEEGIANVVLEAMALGLPVIASDCGGMAEVVKLNETGWLVPARDSKAIVNAILNILSASERKRKDIAQNAHNFIKTKCSEDKNINEFIDLYTRVYSSK